MRLRISVTCSGIETDGRLVEDQHLGSPSRAWARPNALAVPFGKLADETSALWRRPHASSTESISRGRREDSMPFSLPTVRRYTETGQIGIVRRVLREIPPAGGAPRARGSACRSRRSTPARRRREDTRQIRIVVVLPAPFGPRKPAISPRGIENETSSIARNRPEFLGEVEARSRRATLNSPRRFAKSRHGGRVQRGEELAPGAVAAAHRDGVVRRNRSWRTVAATADSSPRTRRAPCRRGSASRAQPSRRPARPATEFASPGNQPHQQALLRHPPPRAACRLFFGHRLDLFPGWRAPRRR